jgi:predicted transposase/invertase (TIGR01784 family)
MCHINPRVDFAFKKLFGSEENKELLISLINAIVGEKDQVESLILRNPYNLADYKAGKMSVLDIKAQDSSGRWFNVEMQMSQDLNYDSRALYYWARLLSDQLGEGMVYTQLCKTISINILNFDLNRKHDAFHSRYRILNVDTGDDDAMPDVFDLHYVELTKFHKDYSDVATVLDRWSLFLTRAHEINKENIPASLSCDPAIVSAIQKVDRMFDEDERKMYDIRMHDLCDVASKIESAREEGLNQGRDEGVKEGRNSMVVKAHEAGMTASEIAAMFDIPEREVELLLVNLNDS